MKHVRSSARWVLLVMVTLSGLLATASAGYAQGNATSFVSPMTGIPITTTGPWTIDTTSLYSQDGVESLTLWGPTEFMQVWFLPGNVPLVEARDVVLESYAQEFGTFIEIDRGAYGNVSYSLDITSAEGVEFGVFSLFLGQRPSGYVEYYVFFGSLPLFAQGFATAQQNVRVNNTAVFDGVDGQGLQNLLTANAGITGAAGTTTQAPPPPQPTQPAQGTTQPTQPPATTGQTGTTSTPEGQAYLAALDAEMTYLQGTIDTYLTNYLIENETQAQELNRIGQEWSAYPNRAATIVAPPGFETIDQQYRTLASAVGKLGTLWQGVVTAVQNNDGTFSTKMVDLTLEVFLVQAQITELQTAMTSQQSGGTTTTQPTQDTTQPTQPPADTGQTGTTGVTAEQMAYIESMRAETARLDTSITDFTTKFGMLAQGTSPNGEQTAQEIGAIIDMWLNMPQTATQLVAPAGMEDVDAAYKQLANDFSTAATTFNTALQQQGSGDTTGAQATLQQFNSQIEALGSSIDSLNALLDQKAAGGTTGTTTQPTQDTTAPQPTQPPADTGQTGTTSSPDGDAYLESLTAEIDNLRSSIASFGEGLQMIQGDDPAAQEEGNQMVSDAVNVWLNYQQTSSAIVAPPGFEAIDAQYRQLATDVQAMGDYFLAFVQGTDQAAKDQALSDFSATLESVQTQIDSLEAAIGGASTGTTPQDTTTTQPTQAPADTGQTGTTETPTTEAGGPTDVTETGNRGQLPNVPGDTGTTGNTGTTQTGENPEDLGFIEQGQYESPQFGVEVTWDDRFEFDPEYLDVTISSNEDEGVDAITLVWTGGDGDITVSILEADGFDPADQVAFWESDEYLGQFDANTEVLLSDTSNDRGAVLILVGDDTALYREAVCIDRRCTQVAYVMVISSIDDAPDIIADAEEGVEIDGEPATGVFSTREINRALP